MSATYAWSVVAWLGGIVTGVAVADGLTALACGGGAMSVLAFVCIRKFGEVSNG